MIFMCHDTVVCIEVDTKLALTNKLLILQYNRF